MLAAGKLSATSGTKGIGETVLLESDTFGVRFPRYPKEELTRTFGCYLLGIHTFKADGGTKDENESEAEVYSGRGRVDCAGGVDYIRRTRRSRRRDYLPRAAHRLRRGAAQAGRRPRQVYRCAERRRRQHFLDSDVDRPDRPSAGGAHPFRAAPKYRLGGRVLLRRGRQAPVPGRTRA